MFTGLIADVGELERLDASPEGGRLRVATALAGELSAGDSIAVNGVCLTVANRDPGAFEADAMNQTLRLTALGELAPGDAVNLEPALRASDRLGGHIVQGHVDGTGEIVSVAKDGFARRIEVAVEERLRPYLVERGSIALDGVSLTIAELGERGPVVSLIPETLERTTFGKLTEGRRINVEVDVIARYAERLLQGFEEGKDR